MRITESPRLAYDVLMETRRVAKEESAHGTNPIASFLRAKDGRFVSSSNVILHAFVDDRPENVKLGSSSPSKHSETAAIAKASRHNLPTDGAEIVVTDPLCPNCMNAVVAAGITDIYVDAEAMDKDGTSEWYSRRGHHFDTTSLQIAANAGVRVHTIRPHHADKLGEIASLPLPEPTKNVSFAKQGDAENGVYDITRIKKSAYKDKKNGWIKSVMQDLKKQFSQDKSFNDLTSTFNAPKAWAAALIPTDDPDEYLLVKATSVQMVDLADIKKGLGATKALAQADEAKRDAEMKKYKARIFPLDHLRSVLAKEGISIEKGTQILASKIPSSHETVALCDELPNIQLHIADPKNTWMKEDKAALGALAAIGADPRITPELRKVNDVISPQEGDVKMLPYLIGYSADEGRDSPAPSCC